MLRNTTTGWGSVTRWFHWVLGVLIIGMLMYFGRVQYVRAALEAAGASGARFAATSLSGEKGCQQAREAMVWALVREQAPW